jgi:UDP-N-acetylglucosamine 4,6-dehydratase/5-epimerase
MTNSLFNSRQIATGVLDGKILGITGGTGSFGSALIRKLLLTEVSEIRVISRDEDKQERLLRTFMDPRIKCIVADVRDREKMKTVLRNVDILFHAAALKQVPTGEFFPTEVIATNTLGSENILIAAVHNQIGKVVLLSTDKAVNPINAMGMSKALMEKIGLSFARLEDSNTSISITRYGNVLCSRGSVIPKFVEQRKLGQPITLTDGQMTRFLMSLDEAIDLVFYAILNGQNGDTFIKHAPAAKISDLAVAVSRLVGSNPLEFNEVGIRYGEKIHESLISDHEISAAISENGFFRIPLERNEINSFRNTGRNQTKNNAIEPYTSDSTVQLDTDQIIKILESNYEFNLLLKSQH